MVGVNIVCKQNLYYENKVKHASLSLFIVICKQFERVQTKKIAFDDSVTAHWRIQGGALGTCPRVQIFSFSCSFWEKLGKIIGWCPHLYDCCPLWRIIDPPLEPVSTNQGFSNMPYEMSFYGMPIVCTD